MLLFQRMQLILSNWQYWDGNMSSNVYIYISNISSNILIYNFKNITNNQHLESE